MHTHSVATIHRVLAQVPSLPARQWLQQRVKLVGARAPRWKDAFNAGKFDDVAKLYHPAGLLIPPTGDKFLKQPELALLASRLKALDDLQLKACLEMLQRELTPCRQGAIAEPREPIFVRCVFATREPES